MRQANREAIAEMAITIRVIAENGRYNPVQIAGLADSITALSFEDAFGGPAIDGNHDCLAIARGD